MEVGFSQRVRLEWLQHTAVLFLAGRPREEIKATLQELLQDQLSVGGTAERGNREKAVTILLKIWVGVPRHLEALRNDGMELLKRLPVHEQLAMHWGMTIAVYPFFGIVAEAVGRLLRLQGSFTASQMQRRVREHLGERETVARAARRVLRCFVDWRVLEEAKEKGVYQGAPPRHVQNTLLVAWLVEAVLTASNGQAGSLNAIVHSPVLFPFAVEFPSTTILESRSRLEVFRQGFNETMVTLRRYEEVR